VVQLGRPLVGEAGGLGCLELRHAHRKTTTSTMHMAAMTTTNAMVRDTAGLARPADAMFSPPCEHCVEAREDR
jgi:hypothetical protein